jgi:hypothetical protein
MVAVGFIEGVKCQIFIRHVRDEGNYVHYFTHACELVNNELGDKMKKQQQDANEYKPRLENNGIALGVVFACCHFLIFVLAAYYARGIGVYGHFIWIVVDFPFSLLFLLVMQHGFTKWLFGIYEAVGAFSIVFYPPYFIHGLLGTIWWGILPTFFLKCRHPKRIQISQGTDEAESISELVVCSKCQQYFHRDECPGLTCPVCREPLEDNP